MLLNCPLQEKPPLLIGPFCGSGGLIRRETTVGQWIVSFHYVVMFTCLFLLYCHEAAEFWLTAILSSDSCPF